MKILSLPDTLQTLSWHSEQDVVRLVEDVRTLASELLLTRMEAKSREAMGDSRNVDLPRLLWRAVHDPESNLEETEAHEFLRLAETCDGWWMFGADDGLELIPLSDWVARVRS